jgi:outer membrane usher protein
MQGHLLKGFLFIFSSFLLAAEVFLMPVPLYVDSIYSGEIDLQIDNDIIRIQPYPLIERLKERLDWNKAQVTLNRWSEDQWVTPESLSTSIIRPEFDTNNLILKVHIPPESRKPETLSLLGKSRIPLGEIYPQAVFSGILNLDSWTRYQYEDMALDYRIAPELVLQYGGYVMEARGGLQSGLNLLYYDYIRLVKDFPGPMYRAEVGDITFKAGGFSTAPIKGVSFYRMTSLNEDYQSRPALGRQIYFPEPADVEIIINNRTVSRHRVNPGTWTFESFPLVQGANDIIIKWTDSQGDHEDRFFHIYDGKLLKPGEFDFGAAAGTDSYTTLNPAFLVHIANGVTGNLTSGANIYYDVNNYHFALGAPLLLATSIGSFNLIPRLDLYMTGGIGLDTELNYSYSEKRDEKPDLNFGTSLGYTTATYPVPLQRFNFTGYYNFNPVKGLSFTPSLGWSWDLSEDIHDMNIRIRVRKSTGDGSIISTDLGLKHDETGWYPLASITFSTSLHEIQQNFYARGDLSSKKMTLAWNRYSSSEKQSDYTLGASGIIPAERDDRLTLSMNGGYTHQYFTASASQGFNAFLGTEEFGNTTSLNLGSALVFAEGVLGFSRPVRSGFLLIQSEMGPLDVNPDKEGALLSLNGSTPGVLGSASPYRYTTYRLVPETLPVGSDINDYKVTLFPTYRSGTLFRAQAKVFMYAGGILLDNEGEPAGLRVGTINSVNGEEQEFFTDDSGYFECYSLIPGEYTLTLDGSELVYTISVKEDESGFYALKEVRPEN